MPCSSATRTISAPPQLQVHRELGIEKESVAVQWKKVHTDLSDEIKVRHYSPKRLKVYGMWAKKFQSFTQNKSPMLLSSDNTQKFLKHLAVKVNVPVSTQNQAFNALFSSGIF
jgi:hypothetical protein